MIDRSTILHGSLAVAAVVVAATAWLQPKGAADDQVTVIDGKADETSELRWTDGDAEVTLARAERGVQVAVTSKKAAASTAVASAADGAIPAPARTRTYPGTDSARDLFTRLVPFRATRDLGRPSAADLASFGLDKPAGKLVLKIGNEEHSVELGGSTFGGGSAYVRAGDRVYLVKATTFSALRGGATSLTERSLVTVPREKVERVTIASGGRRREVLQRFADDRARSFFADPAEPEKRLVQTGNWIDRLMRTRMADFAAEAPKGEPALVVDLAGERKPLATVKVWPAGDATAVVVSSAYAEPLTIPKAAAEALLKDLDAVLGEGEK